MPFSTNHLAKLLSNRSTLANERALRSPRRNEQRGTVLLMVLGLLIVLALIGISFTFLVILESRSAENQLNRFRAQSAAKDGVAYAIARLRAEAQCRHFEANGQWSFNAEYTESTNDSGVIFRKDPRNGQAWTEEQYLREVAGRNRLDGSDPRQVPSFSLKYSTNTSTEKSDDNWVDHNGDGVIDPIETQLGKDLVELGDKTNLDRVSYIVGDGIDGRVVRGLVEGGTYRELGDRARLKVIDTNSQFAINDYEGDKLFYMLTVLGKEIEKAIGSSNLIAGGIKNPFDEERAKKIVIFKEENLGRIGSKRDLLQFFEGQEELYHFAMDFIAIQSFPNTFSQTQETAFSVDRLRNPRLTFPLSETPRASIEGKYDRFSPYRFRYLLDGNGALKDGDFEIQPDGARIPRSPININTVTTPVLTAMIAGLEAEARFLFYPNPGEIMAGNVPINAVNRLVSGAQTFTTDAGRQAVKKSGFNEAIINPLGGEPRNEVGDFINQASYQLIPIGPFNYEGVPKPPWKKDAALKDKYMELKMRGDDHASNLARMIIKERDTKGPFQSWMDFEYRICHQILEAWKDASGTSDTTSDNNADLVYTGRSSRTDSFSWPGKFRTVEQYLPDPTENDHPIMSADASSTSYSKNQLFAWYWKATVDVLRANFAPDGYYNKTNPDAAYYKTVDSLDMTYSTAPLCFSSMGVYEIISQGEITKSGFAPNVSDAEQASFNAAYPVAQRTVRSVVEVYSIYQHSSQADFLSSIDPESFKVDDGAGTSTRRTDIPTVVPHSMMGTKTFPNSVNLSQFEKYSDEYSSEIGKDDKRQTKSDSDIVFESAGSGGGTSGSGAQGWGFADITPTFTDGYYSPTDGPDTRFGSVTLYPRDRSPIEATKDKELNKLLNFYAPYNYTLQAMEMQRGNPDRRSYVPLGTAYTSEGARLNGSKSTATPAPYRIEGEYNNQMTGFLDMSKADSEIAARYSSLRPDGVLLRGWHIAPQFRLSGSVAGVDMHGLRERQRPNRLSILRYRNGGQARRIYYPIDGIDNKKLADQQMYPGGQARVSPSDPNAYELDWEVAVRIFGENQNKNAAVTEQLAQGTDTHNIGVDNAFGTGPLEWNFNVQNSRQSKANLPYYEGVIDMWIKWDLPPQGNDKNAASAGEIDPGSGNFSGLLGATSYGRFAIDFSATDEPGVDYSPANLGRNTDFEGSQLYIFKEPGGVLRISHLYFTQAYTVESWNTSGNINFNSPASDEAYKIMGNQYRIFGRPTSQPDPNSAERVHMELDELVATNDILSFEEAYGGRADPGKFNDGDLGFAQARTDTFIDLNEADPKEFTLVTHNWYRLTIQYRNNYYMANTTAAPKDAHPEVRYAPHVLYIDGKRVNAEGDNSFIAAVNDPAFNGSSITKNKTSLGINTGQIYEDTGAGTIAYEHRGLTFVSDPTDPAWANTEKNFIALRASAISAEVDPEDMLTIGCIYRRQRDEIARKVRNPNDVETRPDKDGEAPMVPLFRYDTNVAAPANATIDDVRITMDKAQDSLQVSETSYGANARYELKRDFSNDGKISDRGIFVNGFIANVGFAGRTRPVHFPVRVGSLTWVEHRPRWDPYTNQRLDTSESKYSKAPQLKFRAVITDDIETMGNTKSSLLSVSANGEGETEIRYGTMNSMSRASPDFWLAGGGPVQRENDGKTVWMRNNALEPGHPKVAYFKYMAAFIVPSSDQIKSVLNTSPVLDSVRLTVLTPPRVLYTEEVTN